MIPKFRFWYEREDYYPDENYMRHVWGIEYITDSKIELNDDYIFNPYTNVAENIYAKTKIYLMQSTGLKDKNGVEIYEGDICNVEINMWGTIMIRTGEVIFNEDDVQSQIVIEDFLTITGKSEFETSEVIGNIYEKEVTK